MNDKLELILKNTIILFKLIAIWSKIVSDIHMRFHLEWPGTRKSRNELKKSI